MIRAEMGFEVTRREGEGRREAWDWLKVSKNERGGKERRGKTRGLLLLGYNQLTKSKNKTRRKEKIRCLQSSFQLFAPFPPIPLLDLSLVVPVFS